MSEITKIKLFLASSIVEFKQERMELGCHILTLNNMFIDRGVYLWLSSAETLSKAMTPQGSQDFYNQKIQESKYFYLIAGKAIGERTREEFEVAWKHFKNYGSPEIHTYFRKITDKDKEDQSVTDFKRRLDGLNHYYEPFENLDTIKLTIQQDAIRAAWDSIIPPHGKEI